MYQDSLSQAKLAVNRHKVLPVPVGDSNNALFEESQASITFFM